MRLGVSFDPDRNDQTFWLPGSEDLHRRATDVDDQNALDAGPTSSCDLEGRPQCIRLLLPHCRNQSSPPANRTDGERIFPSQLDFFRFMADHKAFTFTQRVLHPVQTNFDFQHLAVVG